jgi:hypothetical protein
MKEDSEIRGAGSPLRDRIGKVIGVVLLVVIVVFALQPSHGGRFGPADLEHMRVQRDKETINSAIKRLMERERAWEELRKQRGSQGASGQ